MTLTRTPPFTPTAKHRVSVPRAIRAELVKFFTLTSNRVMVAVTTLFVPASASLLATSLANPSGNRPPGSLLDLVTPLMFVDSVLWVQMLFAIVVALLVTGEYSSGQIKLSFLAVPGRSVVLFAKAMTAAAVGFGIGFVGALAAQAAPMAILTGSGVRYDYEFTGTLVLAAKCGLYLAAVGVLVVGIAFLVRNTVVGMILPVLLLTLIPEVIRSIPVDSVRAAVEYFPSIAGRLLVSGLPSGADLSDWQGYAVMGAWAVAVLAAAVIVVRRKDA